MPLEHKLLYFHFKIADKAVQLRIAGPDGAVLEEATSVLNFEDNLFSALNVLLRLMTRGGRRNSYRPDREFIRKIGGIQASLLNIVALADAAPVEVQSLFEKYWKQLGAAADARACFSFDFAPQAPYTDLAELPWEFLAYQNQELATADAPPCDFVRLVPLPKFAAAPKPRQQDQALNILLILSEPEPEALRSAESAFVGYRESFIFRILRAYENLVFSNETNHPVEVRVLYQPRQSEVQQIQLNRRAVEFGSFLERFQEKMLEPDHDLIRDNDNPNFNPDIVHFLGHVTPDERDDDTVACPRDSGLELDYVHYQAFANCFASAPPALFILQTPEGVPLRRSPVSKSGLLLELLQKQIPYVLSFQHPMGEQSSMAFVRELYRQLLTCEPVPSAVRESRVKLARELGNVADANAFGSPALYLGLPADGNLHFRLRSETVPDPGKTAADTAALQQLDIQTKLDWYNTEIQNLVQQDKLDAALEKLKEILSAIKRSENADIRACEDYINEVILLMADLSRANKSYDRREINLRERSDKYKNIGARILDYLTSNKLPALLKKPGSERVADAPAQAKPKSKDRMDLTG